MYKLEKLGGLEFKKMCIGEEKEMKERLLKIKDTATAQIAEAQSLDTLEGLRIELLGKKGALTEILKGMGKLSKEERPEMGKVSNEVRNHIEDQLAQKKTLLEAQALKEKLKSEVIDVTIPGKAVKV